MDNAEYMRSIKERLERLNAYDERNLVAERRNKDELDDLVKRVNNLFAKHKVAGTISRDHIRFNADYIGNIFKVEDKSLSHIIFDHYFPQPNRTSYYHFTNLSAFGSMLAKKKLRLSNLNKRFADGEFTTFYEEHGMDGYRTGGNVLGIDTSQEAIMSEIFFMSLTGSGYSYGDDSFWNDFGDHGNGVRLEFRVTPKTRDFREVFYSSKGHPASLPLLKELFSEIKDAYGVPLNFTYSSKIGAFYIQGRFKNEDEFRFLVKRTSDDYGAMHLKPVVTDPTKGIAYIELDFHNDYAEFELISVQPGFDCSSEDLVDIANVVKSSGLNVRVLPKARSEVF